MPTIIQHIFKFFSNHKHTDSVIADYTEDFNNLKLRKGKAYAAFWLLLQILLLLPVHFKNVSYWGGIMFTNYLKLSFRNIKRTKIFSVINISGLTIGLASCLLIILYLFAELNYDKYHEDYENIFRVGLNVKSESGTIGYAVTSPPAAPALKKDFPQIQETARVFYWNATRTVKKDDKLFYETGFVYADPQIFNILKFNFINGSQKSALENPLSIVIPKRLSEKYFGSVNSVGEMLLVNNVNYKITGVIEDLPAGTHFSSDIFVPIEDLRNPPWLTDWSWPGMYTYIKVKHGTNIAELTSELKNFSDSYTEGDVRTAGKTYTHFLQRIDEIYLDSQLEYEMGDFGNRKYLYIFGIVGVFILLLASVNYMNLSTARSFDRAKEVGLRKVAGADRSQLGFQFLGESFFMTILATIAAVFLVVIILPYFNQLTGLNLEITGILNVEFFSMIFLLAIIVSFFAGLYPAFLLSKFQPVNVLTGSMSKFETGSSLRKAMVVGQFTISIILITGSLVMLKQFNFMRNKDLGFDKQQKLVLPVTGMSRINSDYQSVKNDFLRLPGITAVSVSGTVPGEGAGSLRTKLSGSGKNEEHMMYYNFIEPDFINLYNIDLIAGRNLNKLQAADLNSGCLINEAAVKAFGWSSAEEAIGSKIETGLRGTLKTILGVVKDYHYRSVRYKVDPLVIEADASMYQKITLSLAGNTVSENMDDIKNVWMKSFPDRPFNYFFIDANFERLYVNESRMNNIFTSLTYLAIFIACLGLFGLSISSAAQRRKEIGIRKVLGASATKIVILLVSNFTKWIILANLIALPVAYFLSINWLNDFAYKINLDIEIFMLSLFMSVVSALLVTGAQTLKAALANPVKTIKYE